MKTTAVYAGSFDPVTYGHIDVIKQSINMFDEVYVLIASNPDKKYMFTESERYNMLALWRNINGYAHIVNVFVTERLVVDFASDFDHPVLVRGVRNMTDMIAEMSLADVNQEVGGIKTIFIPTSNENRNFSSSLVKELWKYGKDISKYVPLHVSEAMADKR
jgi:pantetheine-phosphate adenylyltransferase